MRCADSDRNLARRAKFTPTCTFWSVCHLRGSCSRWSRWFWILRIGLRPGLQSISLWSSCCCKMHVSLITYTFFCNSKAPNQMRPKLLSLTRTMRLALITLVTRQLCTIVRWGRAKIREEVILWCWVACQRRDSSSCRTLALSKEIPSLKLLKIRWP